MKCTWWYPQSKGFIKHGFLKRILTFWGFDAPNRSRFHHFNQRHSPWTTFHDCRHYTEYARCIRCSSISKSDFSLIGWKQLVAVISSFTKIVIDTKPLTQKFAMISSLFWTVEWHREVCNSESNFCSMNNNRQEESGRRGVLVQHCCIYTSLHYGNVVWDGIVIENYPCFVSETKWTYQEAWGKYCSRLHYPTFGGWKLWFSIKTPFEHTWIWEANKPCNEFKSFLSHRSI